MTLDPDERAHCIPTSIAAARCGVKRELVTTLARRGAIDAYQKGRLWHVSLESLERYLANDGELQKKHETPLIAPAVPASDDSVPLESGETADTKDHTQTSDPSAPVHTNESVEVSEKPQVHTLLHTTLKKKTVLAHQLQTTPLYAVHPMLEIAHRATALISAVVITISIASIAFPNHVHRAITYYSRHQTDIHERLAMLVASDPITRIAHEVPKRTESFDPYRLVESSQLAAAVSVVETLALIARRFNTYVNVVLGTLF